MTKIPHISHFYWDGSRLSYLHYLTIVSFHKYNPDWNIKLYYPSVKYAGKNTWKSKEHSCTYIGINYLKALQRLEYITQIEVDFTDYGISNDLPETYKSDFLRWRLLTEEGGLWSDMDILYIKPIQALNLNADTDLVLTKLAIPKLRTSLHIIGFYLSKSGSLFFDHISKNASSININDYQSIGSKLLNRLYPEHKDIISVCGDINIKYLDMDVVYPYPPEDADVKNQLGLLYHENNLSRITKNTIGIHWYNGHIFAKNFINEYNHFNADEFNNTLHTFVKLLGDDRHIQY